MARRRSPSLAARQSTPPARVSGRRQVREHLGPGLHVGQIELCISSQSRLRSGAGRLGQRYRVRLQNGQRLMAGLAPEVQVPFAQQCLRESRPVLLMDTPQGPCIAGALQVACSPSVDHHGVLALTGQHLRLQADRSLSIEVPDARLTLDQEGMRLDGDKLIIDMAAIVRILTAQVDIP
jgi:hypothetical protein